MSQKPALGKGLASLFPGFPPAAGAPIEAMPHSTGGASSVGNAMLNAAPNTASLSRDRVPGISMASIDEIKINSYQPRHDFDTKAIEELAQSIRESGLIQPLIVRKAQVSGYELIAGERRLRASKLAGLKQVPIVIRKSTDREALELAIIENVQRQDLNPMDEAMAYHQLGEEFHLTQEEIARRVGKERSSIANHLRLLKLPDSVQRRLRSGALSLGHAKVILGLESTEAQTQLADRIVAESLSVRAAERALEEARARAAQKDAPATPPAQMTPVKARLDALSLELTRRWSSRVQIKGTERKGKIVFQYANRNELERLIAALQNQELWRGTPPT